MKKLFSVLAASIVLGSFAFAQEEEKSEATVAFKNELSSDTVELTEMKMTRSLQACQTELLLI